MKSLIPWRNKRESAAPVVWVDDWFDRSWENPFEAALSPLFGPRFGGVPTVDVAEDKNEVTVKTELPGMTEKDIDLTWYNGVLRIRGEKKSEKEEKKKGRYYRECSYGSFSRDIPLGDALDWNGATAKCKNGVLTVKMPKTEHSRKTIEVKVN
ncbi:MAG: Hsp20/alpha crystallin family protein [Chitinispirillaceae bacterium]|nr:Hsp20/alpha crystallin family protein [Chitinispirillaceae bacterium]